MIPEICLLGSQYRIKVFRRLEQRYDLSVVVPHGYQGYTGFIVLYT